MFIYCISHNQFTYTYMHTIQKANYLPSSTLLVAKGLPEELCTPFICMPLKKYMYIYIYVTNIYI